MSQGTVVQGGSPLQDTETRSVTMEQDPQENVKSIWRIMAENFFAHRMATAGLIVFSLFLIVCFFAPQITKSMGINYEDADFSNRFAPVNSITALGTNIQENRIEYFVMDNPGVGKQIAKALVATGEMEAGEDVEEAPYILNEILAEGESRLVTQDVTKTKIDPQTKEEVTYTVSENVKTVPDPEAAELREELLALDNPGVEKIADLRDSFFVYHPLGTNEVGRDILAMLLFGGRISLSVALIVGLAMTVIGLTIGMSAGYFGGFTDTVLMRLTDALLSLPALPLFIMMSAVDLNKVVGIWNGLVGGPGALLAIESITNQNNASLIKMVFILTLLFWMQLARVVRGTVLSVRENEYVLSAKTIGRSHFTIMLEHILPNILGPTLVALTLGMSSAIFVEAGLSFLGLGIQSPMTSWGVMMSKAKDVLQESSTLLFAPGICIVLVVLSLNYIGDGLRDALDPKSIKR